MLVRNVMTKNPVTISCDKSVPEAKELMRVNNINKLPVVDKSGALVGIITRNDLVKASPSDATTLDMFELSYLLNKMTVEKVMVKKVKTVSPEETVEEAARLMDDYNIGCMPVLQGDLVVGIITESDLFRAFIDMFGTRHAGVRATFVMGDEPGNLSVFTKRLAELGGNIVSLVTAESADAGKRTVTMRVTGVEKSAMEQLVKSSGCELQDLRNV